QQAAYHLRNPQFNQHPQNDIIGDVYLADCGEWRGSIQGGIRPVVVMQNDTGNRHSPTLCVVKLTSKVKKRPNQPTHYMLKNVRGIPYPSQVLAEQPDTINKSDIIRYMAHLSDKHMAEISRCIQVEMALVSNTPRVKKKIKRQEAL
ncbi:MAG: type II toxin-antitoxin system PemK/MazF family toxin, partial [Clostridiales bacterium]|nr:type II toxin-antitoxin system PemK/MazF family toxin [Clostridiales bacterium]